MTITHEQYIHKVRDIVLSRVDDDTKTRLSSCKLVYGCGDGRYRGITHYFAWQNGKPDSGEFVEIAATGEESPLQLAGTTIHELAHVLAGYGAGHGLKEVEKMRHALRIGGTMDEYKAVVKELSQKVKLQIPIGELAGPLTGFGWAWKMQGRLGEIEPIEKTDKLNAQGLEGKVSVEMTLYDALFVSLQASSPYRTQIIEV